MNQRVGDKSSIRSTLQYCIGRPSSTTRKLPTVIPNFNHSHVLPPFLGDSPSQAAQASPYTATAGELVARLGNTPQRCTLLKGLFAYRRALIDLGFSHGFQWLDGSFVEDIEAHESRSPNDIDVVTFANTPSGLDPNQVQALALAHPEVFEPAQTKRHFGCDAYLVRLDGSPERLVSRAAYYQGLFSHRRSDNMWKGMLMLQLQSDDSAAVAALSHSLEGGHDAAPT